MYATIDHATRRGFDALYLDVMDDSQHSDPRTQPNAASCELWMGDDQSDAPASLWNVETRDAYRRRGIARAMVATACVEAASNGAAFVRLYVYLSNAPAIACYRALGFTFVDPLVRGAMDSPRLDPRQVGIYRTIAADVLSEIRHQEREPEPPCDCPMCAGYDDDAGYPDA